MRNTILITAIALALCACSSSTPPAPAAAKPAEPPVISARLATVATFRHAASDAAVWIDPADPARSILLVAGGEGGLEMNDLTGARVARFEALEAGFIQVRQGFPADGGSLDLAIVSDQRAGALRVFKLDAAARQLQEITTAPIAINDAITGLCTYRSSLTGKLYAFAATDQGQLEQWEVFVRDGKAGGQFIRRIPAGKGASHCTVDDAGGALYFSEESAGIWQVAAEPESDAARTPVDLIAPRGTLHEEVKGLALYRTGDSAAFLVASDAGSGTFNVYSPVGEPAGTFKIGGNSLDVGDAEGLTIVSAPLGDAFPQGALIVADEDSGDYKLVAWNDIAQALKLASPTTPAEKAPGAVRVVKPRVETVPADSYGDAADDPAIWVDERNPSRSVVIGTDKKLGLNVYDLEGKRLQVVPDGRMNNVDLREGFLLAGKPVTIVAATNRTTKSISLYQFDPASRRLSAVADGTLDSGFDDPYGLCMYRSAKSGDYFVLANDSAEGRFRQWKLIDRNGKAAIELVREFTVGTQAEGCAADDELGQLYIAEEDVGLWKYSAEPDGGATRTAIDKVGEGRLTDDVEGVSVYYGQDGKGYLVVSNQGEDNYAIYRREGANEFVGKFHVVANEALGIDGSSETDGLDVVSYPLGAGFPAGLLVVQDGRNLMPAERQNFKYVSWQDVMEALK